MTIGWLWSTTLFVVSVLSLVFIGDVDGEGYLIVIDTIGFIIGTPKVK